MTEGSGYPPRDVEASDYDLGTTSARLVRVGKLVQVLFSNKQEAAFFYAELASRFKRMQDELNKSRP